MNRWIYMTFAILVVLGVGLALGACAMLRQDRFGKNPSGARLDRLQMSPHFSNGEFHNTVPTRTLADGQSTLKILWDNLWADTKRLRPVQPLPVMRPDLQNPQVLDRGADTLIWLGHSSYFMQLAGQRLLVDPVFSDHGAPFSFMNTSFPGTDLYTAADMPELDWLLITHDHWDHLDYETVMALRNKVRNVLVPLGVGAHFERWGWPPERVHEADWNTTVRENGLVLHVVPARHYSGRSLERNKTLWAGFVLETSERRILLSGDTGYGPHIADIARTFGSFDLVALDGGQYDPRWPLIHMTPEQAVQAARELGARAMLLAHVGRFCISSHSWDEPFIRAVQAAQDSDLPLLTPKIGEPVLFGTDQQFAKWWEGQG